MPADTKTEPCKCLEIIEANLTKHHGEGSAVRLELKTTINTATMQMGQATPPLAYSYMAGKKRRKSFITFNFCPFCGQDRR